MVSFQNLSFQKVRPVKLFTSDCFLFFYMNSLYIVEETLQPISVYGRKSENGKPVGQVTNLVGSNFNKHIFDRPNIDVLAFFYAPW